MVDDPKAPQTARVAASQALPDRGWGARRPFDRHPGESQVRRLSRRCRLRRDIRSRGGAAGVGAVSFWPDTPAPLASWIAFADPLSHPAGSYKNFGKIFCGGTESPFGFVLGGLVVRPIITLAGLDNTRPSIGTSPNFSYVRKLFSKRCASAWQFLHTTTPMALTVVHRCPSETGFR